jgi:outer membrane protein insertion porin family
VAGEQGKLRARLNASPRAVCFVLAVICLLCPFAAAWGQNMFAGDPIGNIRVEGTQRIEPETVLSYMQLNAGDPFAADRIDKALKNLFATGLFADVAFRREGNTLVVKVVENPIINQIAFEGNDHLDTKDLMNEIQEKPRTVLTQSRVQSDVQRILNLYRRSGRFGATVDPKIIKLDQNRVNLVFEIKEGNRTEVRRISFVGNKAFSDSELRGAILTTETAWYRFLVTTDTYDPDRLQVDRDKLRDFYFANGYIDFKVLSAVAELSPEQDAFYITFTLEEGERYKVGKVDVKTSLRDLDPKVLRSLVAVKEGDWYDQTDVDRTTAALNDALGSLGYAFVDVQTRLDRDPKKKTVDITFNVNEGPKVYVERIDINGNVRTLDSVIRREFRLVEGDAFNTSKLQRTKQRLTNLGFFSNVDVKTLPGSTPDKTVIEVNVEEQSTGELTFGLGYSTSDGPLGIVKITERNLLGKGQQLSLSTNLSFVTSNIVLSFTEPYFLGRPISAGFDVYDTVTNNTNSTFGNSSTPYNEKDLGFGLRAGYDVSEFLHHNIRYSLTQQTISNVSYDAAQAIQQQEGTNINSLISNELVYDRRDNKSDPASGYYIRFRNDISTVPGTLGYMGNRLGGGYYMPLTKSHSIIGSISGEIGYLFDMPDPIPIVDSYQLGGQTFRGFASAGIGPRDLYTQDSLGGKEYAVGTIQVSFPMGLPDEYQVRGHVFSDFGTLTQSDAAKYPNVPSYTVQDCACLRASVGFGLIWKSPFGPLAIDFAYPVLKASFDKTQIINFNVGTSF